MESSEKVSMKGNAHNINECTLSCEHLAVGALDARQLDVVDGGVGEVL